MAQTLDLGRVVGPAGPKGDTGPAGPAGSPGATGPAGSDGKDGVSPTITTSKSGKVTTITIKDANGTKTATINDGSDGAAGKDGYTPQKNVDYFDGQPGKDGQNGKDGVSVTHSWSGTTLTVTSASGTSSVNLKGDKGDTGSPGSNGSNGAPGVGISSVTQTTTSTADGGTNVVTVTLSNGNTSTFNVKNGSKGSTGATGPAGPAGSNGQNGSPGADGQRGTGILKITTAPSGYTTATGGFTPTYRVALSTVKSQSKVSNVLVGDVIQYSYYQYPVGYVDTSYVYTGARNSLRGATGAAGAAGVTPVKGTDYWTEEDQEDIVQQVITALGTPVFGRVDAENNIILTGDLTDGVYTLVYEDAEGERVEVGEINLAEATSGTIAIEWGLGQIDKDTGEITSNSGNENAQNVHTQAIVFESGKQYSEAAMNEGVCGGYRVCYYAEDGSYLGYGDTVQYGNSGVLAAGSHEIPVLFNAYSFRLRFFNMYYGAGYAASFDITKKNFKINWSKV